MMMMKLSKHDHNCAFDNFNFKHDCIFEHQIHFYNTYSKLNVCDRDYKYSLICHMHMFNTYLSSNKIIFLFNHKLILII